MSVFGLWLVLIGFNTYSVSDAQIDDPCYNTTQLDHLEQRVVGYKLKPGEQPVSDEHLKSAWYSTGNYVLASPNSSDCGTPVSWYRKDPLPMDYYLRNSNVCKGHSCTSPYFSIFVRCPDGNFVFFLMTLRGGGAQAYCVEEPTTILTTDPCKIATPLDLLNQRVVGYKSQPGEQPISDGNKAIGWYSMGNNVLASPDSSDCGTDVSWHRKGTHSFDYGLHFIEVYGGQNTINTTVCNSKRCPDGHFVFLLRPLAVYGGGAYCVEAAYGNKNQNDPCYNAKPLDHLEQRVVGYKLQPGDQPISDEHLEPNWYSTGNYILASPNSSNCGTNVAWHRKGPLPIDFDQHKDDVCRGASCDITKDYYSMRCRDGNFVFFLRPLDAAGAYCVEDPAITVTNYNKDPCHIAKPLNHLNQRVVGYTTRAGEQLVSDSNLTLGWYSTGNYILASPNSSNCGTNVSWHRKDMLSFDYGLHAMDVYGGDNTANAEVCNSKRCPGGHFVFFLRPLVDDGGGAYCVEAGNSQPDDPCDNAKPLDHMNQRMVGYKLRSGEKPVSDVNLTDGWYSVGDYILASPNSTGCGTNVPWHRKGPLPVDHYLHQSEVCRGDSCAIPKTSQFTRCIDNHFVFFLRTLDRANEAYCVEDPVKTLTNYSNDPCDIAKPLDNLDKRWAGNETQPGEKDVSDSYLTLGWYSIGDYVLASPNSSDCGTNLSWHRLDKLPRKYGIQTIEVYGGDDNTTTQVANSKRCPDGRFVFFLRPLESVGGGAYCVEDRPYDEDVPEAANNTPLIIGASLGSVALVGGLTTPLIWFVIKKMKRPTKVEEANQ